MTNALIRGEEVIVEPFSQWIESHIAWMIGEEKDADGNPIPGDGWTLVEDYEEGIKVSDEGVEYYEEQRHVL